jgi:Flp pilus assembly pilin Flp
MNMRRRFRYSRADQIGLTYIEVMIALVLIAVALVPALEALHTGMLGAEVYASSSKEHFSAAAKMEEVLAEPYVSLLAAAAMAADEITISSYSDAVATPDRRLVFLSRFDADNADGDNDPFSVPDPNLDGDNNPFTGYAGLIWVQVRIDGSGSALESLSAP